MCTNLQNTETQGRAEPVRLAFAIGGVDFEDNRIAFKDWPSVKPSTPYKSLPVLTIDDDLQIAQSHAILRYAGKLAGLYPTDELEALFVDEALATMIDCVEGLVSYKGSDEQKVKEVREGWIKESFPRYLGALEKRIKDKYEGPFVLGNKLSIADLLIANFVNTCLNNIMPFVTAAAIEDFEGLVKIRSSVWEVPEVKAWYENKEFKKAKHNDVGTRQT